MTNNSEVRSRQVEGVAEIQLWTECDVGTN
jgi:hypothetical protein